jgi:di/tricarboxylate transporter
VNLDLVLVLALLVGAVAAFTTGAVRGDVAALLVLGAVAIFGLAPPSRVTAGFASPAVLSIAGMYVMSAGLSRTGVADRLGALILAWAGPGERKILAGIVGVSGLLSGFMNNVGVAAMMLPVTMKLSRESGVPPSKLLIPMVLAVQVGGSLTLVGTSTNLVAAEFLREAGFPTFRLMDFAAVGGPILLATFAFLFLFAPRFLPVRVPERTGTDRPLLREGVGLEERFFRLTLPPRSLLDGKTLEESLIGSALGVHVLLIERGEERILAPGPGTRLLGGDRLLVQGHPGLFRDLHGSRHLALDRQGVDLGWLERPGFALADTQVPVGSSLEGVRISDLQLRARFGVGVLATSGEEVGVRSHLQDRVIRVGDRLLLHGPKDRLEPLLDGEGGVVGELVDAQGAVDRFNLSGRLWGLQVTEASLFAGRPLGDTRLGDAVGMRVLAVKGPEAGSAPVLLPGADTWLEPGARLLVLTRPEDLAVLRGLQRLELEENPEVRMEALESATAGFVEAVLAPRSSLIGTTLRQAGFRSRFGLHVVAILRGGEALRTQLRDQTLQFGDALLLYGPKRKEWALAREPDLILLHEPGPRPPESRRAPRALLIWAAALVPIIAGWIPVEIGVLAGAAAMVLTRCLTAEEAYQAVEWSVLVMVAGMLALGVALEETGAAAWAGRGVLDFAGDLGPVVLLAALVTLASLASQVMPGAAVIVLVTPVALAGAAELQVAPQALVLGVAMAATSVMSPLSQPAPALVRAPAGYQLADYFPLGVPVTLILIVLIVLLAPLAFPF